MTQFDNVMAMSPDIGETPANDAVGFAGLPHSVTIRRKISAVLLGLIYGPYFAHGISGGFNSTNESVNWLAHSPIAVVVFISLSIALAGFLTAHSAQSATIGIITSAAVAAIYLFGQGLWQFSVYMLLGVTRSALGKALPTTTADMRDGLLFGVHWKHWLWLWIPWDVVVSFAVLLCAPGFILAGGEFESASYRDLIIDILRAVLAGSLVGYATIKLLRTIRKDAPLTRRQSAMRFVLWFGLLAVAAILRRFVL